MTRVAACFFVPAACAEAVAGDAFLVGVVGRGGETSDDFALVVVEVVPCAEVGGVAAWAGVLGVGCVHGMNGVLWSGCLFRV